MNDAGGTVRVELNHADQAALPDGFRLGDNDSRILAVALNFAAEGCDVTLVSKDLPMRVKASSVGLAAEEYRAELAVDTEWRGMAELDVDGAQLDEFYETGTLDLEQARQVPCHTGVVLLSSNGSALGRVTAAKDIRLIKADRDAFGIHGRSAEQRWRWICCWIRLLGSSLSAVELGQVSRRSRCAPVWRRWSSGISTPRWWYSARSAVRRAGTRLLPGTEGEKWHRGPRLSSTRLVRWPPRS